MKINKSERRHPIAVAHPSPPTRPDFCIYGSGTVFLFQPLTVRATAWLQEHFPANSDHQYLAESLAVGHRYIADIILLAIRNGMSPPAELFAEGRGQ